MTDLHDEKFSLHLFDGPTFDPNLRGIMYADKGYVRVSATDLNDHAGDHTPASEYSAVVDVTYQTPASTTAIATIPAGAHVTDVRVYVSQAWNGISPSFTIGNGTDGFGYVFNGTGIDLKTVGTQEAFVLRSPSTTEDAIIYLTHDSSTAGAAKIMIKWSI